MSEVPETLSWMTSDYFIKVLTAFEGHESELAEIKFEIKSGTNKGENFASAIFRVTLNYLLNGTPKTTTLIFKTKSASGAVAEMLEGMGTFENESNVYSKILTRCGELIPDFVIAPRLVFADKNALVLEDLNEKNYKLADRKTRFDVDRTKLVLEKLAKYHAATTAMDPKLFEKYMVAGFDTEDMTPLIYYFMVSLQETVQTLQETPELQKFVEKFADFDIAEQEKLVFRRTPGEKIHVLNHGDLWINNFFFSFTDNKPTDAMMVDYQECFFGSPGIDLNHFLYTSCDFDVLDRLDEMIEFYHGHLAATLKALNQTNIPTIADIKEEFDRKALQGLIVLLSIVPVMMIENPEHANPELFISDEVEGAAEIRREVYGNPKFVEVLKVLLPKILERVVL